mmetsp:Transcript_178818/g.567436  ORF Transcript_178818/g.567436 Transcript_178818/m.567436 type:complete len:145 (-) Transcript_178818:338-772(-)
MTDGRMVYINDAGLAEIFVLKQCDPGEPRSLGDTMSQRLAVIEASLRVQEELAFDGKPLPCLHQAVQALRILNKANGDAKHDFQQGCGQDVVNQTSSDTGIYCEDTNKGKGKFKNSSKDACKDTIKCEADVVNDEDFAKGQRQG